MSRVIDFTYSGDPSDSDKDRVRFEIGDVVEEKALFGDREITAMLDLSANKIYQTCARLCDVLATRFAREENIRTGTYTSDKSRMSTKYKEMANSFRRRGITSAAFRVPALSETTKALHEDDSDVPQPSFKRNMHDTPGVVRETDKILD